jgi:DNA-binding response OmpR family regulator
MKILLVEDDKILAESLAKFLKINEIDVDIARSYSEAADKTLNNKYDFYVIDINLGDGDGIDLLKDLRFIDDNTPAIFISAIRNTSTVVKGFNVGAEDYIKKPFDPEELLIRIKIRLNSKKVLSEINYKDIKIKGNRIFKNGKEIELGEVQRNILKAFIENPERVLSKDFLYQFMQNPSPLALRVAISKLKKKTGLSIKSVRGLGYVLE